MSIVVGTKACNARCPFCVSKTTPSSNMHADIVNMRNLKVAFKCAELGGVSTILLTGKGEPTLYPSLISTYLEQANKYNFPFKELQTNGISLADGTCDPYLTEWYHNGLTTICISISVKIIGSHTSINYRKSKNTCIRYNFCCG